MIAPNPLTDDLDDRGFKHIEQLRLVNTIYAEVAAEPFFSKTYFVHEPESFERVRELSANPVYANFAKSPHYESQARQEQGVCHQSSLRYDQAAVYTPCTDNQQGAAVTRVYRVGANGLKSSIIVLYPLLSIIKTSTLSIANITLAL